MKAPPTQEESPISARALKAAASFIEKARKIHGDKFSYDKVNYQKAKIHVTITCPEHGDFSQWPTNHLSGKGCPKCANELRGAKLAMTTEQFVEKATEVHGDTFDYSKSVYPGSNTGKLVILCRVHGEFSQAPANHLKGAGCPECAIEKQIINRSDTTASFIEKSRGVHGGKYDYSEVEYVNQRSVVTIKCSEHGNFTQIAGNHVRGAGCPTCAVEESSLSQRRTTEWFISQAKQVHGEKFDYSLTDYVTSTDRVRIVCREHGEFQQLAGNHMRGQGCPACSQLEVTAAQTMTVEEFISKAQAVHGSQYSYSLVEYVNQLTKVILVCPEHGQFLQTPAAHSRGAGCPSCSVTSRADARSGTTEDFIKKAMLIHGDLYDYSKVEYHRSHSPVTIICGKHGEFLKTPDNHFRGQGCPSCATIISKPHQVLLDYLDSLNVPYLTNDRSLLGGKELDIYIPTKGLAVEVNGLYYHRVDNLGDRNYHQRKTEECAKLGVQLLHFWDSEIFGQPEIVMSMLKSKLGLVSDRVFARKCQVVNVGHTEFQDFLAETHIQGPTVASIRLGLEFEGDLVAVMGFTRKDEDLQLVRFSVKQDLSVPGGFSRLLTHAITGFKPKVITSFSDDAYSNGRVYETNGFEMERQNPPRLHYTNGLELFNRRLFQRKAMLSRDPSLNPDLPEKKMAETLGFHQVFGNSTRKWVFNVS